MGRAAIVASFVWVLSCLPVIAAPPAPVAQNPGLRDELILMGERDQQVRKFLFEGDAEHPDSATVARMVAVDKDNTARIKEIIVRYGWPGISLVGERAANAAFLVVQHSPDHEFQKGILPLLRQAYEQGETDGESVALLTDRVRLHDDLPQRYGTQFHIEDGRVVFDEIEDRDGVDARRAKLGLPPLEEYRKMVVKALKNGGDQ